MFCCCNAEAQNKTSYVKLVGVLDESDPQYDEGFAGDCEVGGCTLIAPERVHMVGASKANILAGPATPFLVELDRGALTTPFGWRLDFLDKETLFVCGLVPEPTSVVNRYNMSAPAHRRIEEGDFIVSVNEIVRDSANMATILKEQVTVEVLVQRPLKFRVVVDKHGESVGLDVSFSLLGNNLLVEGIQEGAVRSRASDMRVGDRIVSICGVTGSSSALLRAMQEHDPLELECVRLAA
mmetsp:Transcript_73237/g.212094  ORF Transcript_73237/g.212094 Transcript_73237/m.212094 type:complete len:238 (+) Transcript_73237:104-817(+)